MKILIIDDDARNIYALNAILKSKGYDCCTANSAQEGIAMLRTDNEIGIVLLDMMMPDIDGYEALPLIKEMRSVTVIAVTAQAMVGDREKCMEAGADAYVSKPVDIDILVPMIERYIKNE